MIVIVMFGRVHANCNFKSKTVNMCEVQSARCDLGLRCYCGSSGISIQAIPGNRAKNAPEKAKNLCGVILLIRYLANGQKFTRRWDLSCFSFVAFVSVKVNSVKLPNSHLSAHEKRSSNASI